MENYEYFKEEDSFQKHHADLNWPRANSHCPAPSGSQIRELALRLVHCGYQAGHNDTVEGTFSDDPHGTDSEYIHGERVDEIIQDFSANRAIDGTAKDEES